jgi:hypothetical protein
MHTVNLVAKSLIREFDVSKEEINAPKDAQLNHELAELSKDIKIEEWVTAAEQGGSEELVDNVDGLVP